MFLNPQSIRAGRTRGVLLFVIALVVAAIAFAWISAANRGQVTTYLKIPRYAGSIIDDAGLEPWEEYRRRRDDYKTLIVSPLVIDAALQQQDVANLDLTLRHDSSPEWLASAITVDFPSDGEVMQVSMASPRQDAAQAVMILDAVVKAFHDKVLLQQRLVKASSQADFLLAVGEVKQRLDAQLKELHKLQQADPPVSQTEISLLEDRCKLEGKLLAELELKLLKGDLLNKLDERAERVGGTARNDVQILQKAAYVDR